MESPANLARPHGASVVGGSGPFGPGGFPFPRSRFFAFWGKRGIRGRSPLRYPAAISRESKTNRSCSSRRYARPPTKRGISRWRQFGPRWAGEPSYPSIFRRSSDSQEYTVRWGLREGRRGRRDTGGRFASGAHRRSGEVGFRADRRVSGTGVALKKYPDGRRGRLGLAPTAAGAMTPPAAGKNRGI